MKNNLMLASSSLERLASWKNGLSGFVSATLMQDKLITDSLRLLRDEVVANNPGALLLDIELLELNGSHDIDCLRRICTETKTIILSEDISEKLEWELLKAGIRGCCRNNLEPNLLNMVVTAVQQGELWIRRALICRLIDELSKTTSKNKAYRATHGLLNTLTQREYDIALRVGAGESNKQIAYAFDITDRTVKSHLTEIFKKLGVTDRLNLALILVADNRMATTPAAGLLLDESLVNDAHVLNGELKLVSGM